MEIIAPLLDFIRHVDQHLLAFVAQYGSWVYGLLFLIIFVETGVVVFPFLPGDSLLFIVGAMCGAGVMQYWVAAPLMFAAAVLGNQSNYTIGHLFGPRVFQWEQSRFFNKRAFDQAHAFYERWGGITLVIARFMPFVRTFAPFVAGVAQMTRRRFTLFDVTGGALWIFSVSACGLFFGNLEWVKKNLEIIIWSMIFIPGLIAIFASLRKRSPQQ
ncbi:MAG: VTT domain-containing protein [Paucibacter sp.]|nr:VTT domain-containing protein [Roseateles sp.]